MSDLYEDMGVPRDATQDEIKAAYRKASMAAHPDNKETGDEEAFKRLNHANIVLSDPAKREEYDRTGKENTASPEEQENAMALEMLSSMFTQLFTMAEFDPALHDPLIAVKKLVKIGRGKARERQNEIEAVIEKMRKAIKRLHRKGKIDKAGKLQLVLARIEQASNASLDKAKREQRVCNKVLAILKEHTYEIDEPPKMVVKNTLGPEDAAKLQALHKLKQMGVL